MRFALLAHLALDQPHFKDPVAHVVTGYGTDESVSRREAKRIMRFSSKEEAVVYSSFVPSEGSLDATSYYSPLTTGQNSQNERNSRTCYHIRNLSYTFNQRLPLFRMLIWGAPTWLIRLSGCLPLRS